MTQKATNGRGDFFLKSLKLSTPEKSKKDGKCFSIDLHIKQKIHTKTGEILNMRLNLKEQKFHFTIISRKFTNA